VQQRYVANPTDEAVSFDGRKLFETRDGTFDGPGKVGLWTKADSVTYFDQFEMTRGAERR
jgi:hypothetical protein